MISDTCFAPHSLEGDPASSGGVAVYRLPVVVKKDIHLSARLSIDWSIYIPPFERRHELGVTAVRARDQQCCYFMKESFIFIKAHPSDLSHTDVATDGT